MDEVKRKRILVVTYYWPPSGGAGVQRWLKFTKYLPDFGWDPIVFTPENPDFDLKDESLLVDVNNDVEVLKFPIWEPYQIFKKLSGNKRIQQGQILETDKKSVFKRLAIWLRGNLFVPDPRIFWVKPSVDYLTSIIQSNDIKYMITTGPPHSVHLIGKGLKLKNPTLTWVADFRDPWSQWDILKKMKISSFIWKRHLKLEQSVLKMADSVLATGPTAAQEFRDLGARKVAFITNGFDAADTTDEDLSTKRRSQFKVSHLGMLSQDRNPVVLWKVLEELCSLPAFYKVFELHLTGILSPEVVLSIKQYPRLSTKLVLSESIPHTGVFRSNRESDVLILLQTRAEGANSQLPGKLFEYLSAKRPVLALGAEGNDISNILDATKAGKSFGYAEKEEIAKFLVNEFTAWQEGQSNWTFKGVDVYERKHLTKQLDELLRSLQSK